MPGQVRRVAAPLREQVLELLRADILAAEFAPGQRLVESRLCERFEVSRTVIREVLRQLESEALVALVPHRGPVVAELTRADAKALYEVRGALEGLAGALFAERADTGQRNRLRAAMRVVRRDFAGADLTRRLAIKDEFYGALIDGADNEIVRSTLRGIHARVQLLRGMTVQAEGRARRSVRELAQITDAAAVRRDVDAAREACERHVRNAAVVALAELDARATDPPP
ncbi:GntR family transcriptional regulator [Saccharopolyspora cebuensis]|uniref:GntR family transcriptional regulator n=1 Tax=Saccharopolyspora cebuensis TaxID=418759 RepID=A0ABV4CL30_9PSEU